MRWVVVAAEPVTSIDVTAADLLSELDDGLQTEGIKLCFAEMKDPVKDKLKRFEIFVRFGAGEVFTRRSVRRIEVIDLLGRHAVEVAVCDERMETP